MLGRRTLRVHQDMAGLKDSVRSTYGSTGDLDSLIVTWGGPAAFTAPRVFRYTWDALGRRANIHSPLSGGMDVSYAYDAAGTLRRVLADHPQQSVTPLELADSFNLVRPAVDPTGRVLYERTRCPEVGIPASPCRVSTPEEWNAFSTLGWLVRQARQQDTTRVAIDSLRYDASGNIVWRRPDQIKVAKSFVIAVGHNRVTTLLEAGAGDVHYEYLDDGSRSGEWRDSLGTGTADNRWYSYTGVGRTSGIIFVHGDLGTPDTLGSIGSCVTDPLGRQVQACQNGAPLGLDGERIVRSGAWSVASGPGLDDPILALYRYGGATRELFYVTDGQGRHLLATEQSGGLDPAIATQGAYAAWRATGAASVASGYGANRLNTDQRPGLAFYRNRLYDQRTGRWTQEDPLGVAGGLNLYQFNGNNPVTFTDPFGLCPRVKIEGNKIQIDANLQISGAGVADAAAARKGIINAWNGKHAGYEISVDLGATDAPTVTLTVIGRGIGNNIRGGGRSFGRGKGGEIQMDVSDN